MGFNNRTRIAVIIALVAGLLGGNAASALADDEGSNGVIRLDDRFEGWFSNGMVNDGAACGPYAASSDAVVWHLFVAVPDDIDSEDVNVAAVEFGANVASEVRVETSEGRIDMWVQVKVNDPSKDAYARQGAHTSIEDARIHISDEDVRISKQTTIQLGAVCYEGLGPVGEVTIYLQGMVCDRHDRFEGNQIDDASGRWDSTGGDWQLWNKYFKNDAPTVKVVGKTKGCSFSGSQQFAVGTSAGMADYHVIPQLTDAGDNGLIKLSSVDLPVAHQRALFWANDELWFQRLDDQQLGAFQCYDDRLHPDNFEWILIRDYNRLPSSITCIAWNVTAAAS